MWQKLLDVFVSFSPIVKFSVQGQSMLPTFKAEDKVLASKIFYVFQDPKPGDIIIARNPSVLKKQYIIKRIESVDGAKFFIVGDNKKQSTDSRHFGPVTKRHIVGKVFFQL